MKHGGVISLPIECFAYPRWSPAFPVVAIVNSDGSTLVSASSIQSDRGVIRIEFQPPSDGPYWLRIRDLQQGVRGGSEFIYRVRVNPARITTEPLSPIAF